MEGSSVSPRDCRFDVCVASRKLTFSVSQRTCCKWFFQRSVLITHHRMHSGEKQHQCKVCDKRFSISNQLTVHRRIHERGNPYSCDARKKLFSQNYTIWLYVIVHWRTQTKKLFSYDVCEKSFARSTELSAHQRTQHIKKKNISCVTHAVWMQRYIYMYAYFFVFVSYMLSYYILLKIL